MEIGISSACLYPDTIENCLKTVGELGVKTCEIFINCPSEMNPPVINELKSIREYYDLQIRSIHPCTSGFETFMFFTRYQRRNLDSVDFYKKYYETANILGAETVVFHGALSTSEMTPEQYAGYYRPIHEAARAQGIYLAHENVREHLCCQPKYMKQLADLIGEDFRAVLDNKQCRRSGTSEFEFIDLLGDKILQVHLSDFDDTRDCIAPGKGKYDFKKLFEALKNTGYDKSALVELYRHGFGESNELGDAVKYLNSLV